jgi:uncharacterized repeat protein (TIGR03803 family)
MTTAERARVRPAYGVLYGFKGGTGDGFYPEARLINVNGTLYGTTVNGGANHSSGTVFAITTSGGETVLHSFGGSGDGGEPYAGLINVGGTLYGTTYYGGANTYGTVFSITTSGTETVLHSFAGGSGDGEGPEAGLVNVEGTLYGATYDGGAHGEGTVFALTTSGEERVVYSFAGGSGDGQWPVAGLIGVNGTLYGTTPDGGENCEGSFTFGCGTVFAVTTSGQETVLHSFGGAGDGDEPSAGLINVKGTLYGTTILGGANCGSGDGCGTVFAITPSGKERVVYSFKGGTDGKYPEASLINIKGTLYGTTYEGGSKNGGTVFAFTHGKESVLHSFKGGKDGVAPLAALVGVNGTLYGTTYDGGAYNSGTVFSLSP